jgi:hypothetical protein
LSNASGCIHSNRWWKVSLSWQFQKPPKPVLPFKSFMTLKSGSPMVAVSRQWPS